MHNADEDSDPTPFPFNSIIDDKLELDTRKNILGLSRRTEAIFKRNMQQVINTTDVRDAAHKENLVTDAFKEVLVDYKLQFEKHINYLKQTNREQYTSMISINQFNNTTSEKDVSDKNNSLKKENKQDNEKFKKELVSDLLTDSTKFLERSFQTAIKYQKNIMAIMMISAIFQPITSGKKSSVPSLALNPLATSQSLK